MNQKRIAFLLVLCLSVPLPLIQANAAVKAGAKCTKAGNTDVVKGQSYTCIKSGKKLVWNKDKIRSKTAGSQATLEYELQNSNGRVTLVLTSDEISRQLETKGIYSNLVISLTGNGSNLFIVFFLRDYQNTKSETFGFELWKKTVFDGADLKIAIDENMALGSEPNIFYDAGDNDVNPYNRIKWLSEVKVDTSKILKSFSGTLIQRTPEATPNSPSTNKTPQPSGVPTQKPTPTPTQFKAIYKIGEVGPGQGIIFITPQLGQEMFSGRTDILVPTGRYYEMHTQSLGYVSSTSNPTELVSKFRGGGYSDWFIPSIDELKTLEEVSRRSWTNYNLWGQINPTMEVCLSSTVRGGKNILLRNTGRTALETFETTFAYICAVRAFQTK